MTRKQLETHREALQPLLRKRTPLLFDDTKPAAALKADIQQWNRVALQLLKKTPGAKTNADAFAALGRMRYGTLSEVKEQLRARRQVLDQVLAGTGKRQLPAKKPEQQRPVAIPSVKKSPRAKSFDFDVCLSFAGEDRAKVKQVYKALSAAGVKVFYDNNDEISAALWGRELFTYLDDVYQNKARYCLMFLSKDYVRKAWTNHERESAQARAFHDREYILPVRLDDTPVPGIRPTLGFKRWSEGVPNLTKAILKKLGKAISTTAHPSNPGRRRNSLPSGSHKLSGHVVLLGQQLWQVDHLEHLPGQHLELRLKVKAQQLKTLRALADPSYGAQRVPFVTGFDAFDVQVSLLKETTARGSTVVTLKLTPQQGTWGSSRHRVSWNGQSITDIAAQAARHLLMGEQPQGDPKNMPLFSLPSELNQGILSLARRRAASNVNVLQLATYLAVYHLHAENIVDDIGVLTFRHLQGGKVSVTFTGRLKHSYDNERGEIIVKGIIPASV